MIKRNCKQCGKDFVLSDSEIKFFKDKNLDLPRDVVNVEKKTRIIVQVRIQIRMRI